MLKDTLISHFSLFQNHLLDSINDKPLIHFTKYDYGTATLLFLAFSLFVWLYVANSKLMNQLFKSVYATHVSNQLLREESSIISRGTVLLSVMFLLLLTLFIGNIILFYNIVEASAYGILLLKIAGILVASYTIKIVSIRFFGFVFKNGKEASDYIATIVVFWNVLALFLLPILSCLLFLKQVAPEVFIKIGITGIVLLMLVRFGKAVVIGLNSTRISKVYLFLYLCTLEILPFVIAYKFFLINVMQ